MTYKAAAAVDLGGGKAVIIGDPATDKTERLLRAYGRIVDSLQGGTSPPRTWGPPRPMSTSSAVARWALGSSPARARPVTIARHLAGLFARPGPCRLHVGRPISPVAGSPSRMGKVGPPSSSLVEARAEVIVADSNERAVTNAVETYGVKGVDVEDIHTVDCDFYSPCALGGGLNETTIPVSTARRSLSAQQPARHRRGRRSHRSRGIIYAPDFVVNAGGLINVHDELHGYSKMRAMHRVDSIFGATKAILLASRNSRSTRTRRRSCSPRTGSGDRRPPPLPRSGEDLN